MNKSNKQPLKAVMGRNVPAKPSTTGSQLAKEDFGSTVQSRKENTVRLRANDEKPAVRDLKKKKRIQVSSLVPNFLKRTREKTHRRELSTEEQSSSTQTSSASNFCAATTTSKAGRKFNTFSGNDDDVSEMMDSHSPDLMPGHGLDKYSLVEEDDLTKIPLNHSRAIAAETSRLKPMQTGRRPIETYSVADSTCSSEARSKKRGHISPDEESLAISKGSNSDQVESVLVNAKKQGKVLILQLQDAQDVEAVSLGLQRMVSSSCEDGSNYNSYTERIFEEEYNQQIAVLTAESWNDETDKPNIVQSTHNGSISSSPTGHQRLHPNKLPTVVETPQRMTTKQPLPLETEFGTDGINVELSKHTSEVGTDRRTTAENLHAPEVEAGSDMHLNDSADAARERAWTNMRAMINEEMNRKKGSPISVDRFQSEFSREQSTSTASGAIYSRSLGSFADQTIDSDFSALSFDFSDVGSVNTEGLKTVNLPVGEELKDMLKEMTQKGPVVVMKWLNPTF